MTNNDQEFIDFYPYVLCRAGTLPYDLLKSIQWKDTKGLSDLVNEYLELQNILHSNNSSGKQKANSQKQIIKFASGFNQLYSAQQKLHRTAFFALSGNQLLQKGLLQSSISLWEGIQRYRQQPVSVYRKKERQTERSIAQYLARICTKTSPFSTFTGLSLTKLSGKNTVSSATQNKGKIRVNNYVLAQVEELLSGYPDFYQNLSVKINPTLRKESEEYIFLINSRNVESIQRMATNEVLVLLLAIIRESNSGQIKFAELKEKMVHQVDASLEQLDSYLAQLVRYGLLNWVWPVSASQSNWLDELIPWLKNRSNFQGNKTLLNALFHLQETAKQLPCIAAEKRKPLIQESLQQLRKSFEEISSYIPFPQKETKKKAFIAFQETNMTLNEQNLFFEDYQVTGNFDWSKKDLKKGVREAKHLMDLVLPLRLYPEMEVPLHFFKTHYAKEQSISLLRFYEDFYHSIQTENSTLANKSNAKEQQILALRKGIVDNLRTHIKINYDFNVHLPVSVLDTVFSQLPIQQKAALAPQTDSYGVLLQLQKSKDGRYKSYIDAVFTGYGKMLGRFLHLFPEKYTQHVKNWVSELRGDRIWADLSDASFHNANAHPPFLNTSISTSGLSQDSSPSITSLALKDLSVSYDEDSDKLKLFHKGTEITTFNFGLEALQTRSPLYRLLSVFCTVQPDLEPLKIILREATRREANSWILYPRVEIGKYLILQRRTWYIPKSEIPLRKNQETEAIYFLKINAWRQKNHLPESVFTTVQPTELAPRSEVHKLPAIRDKTSDDYKPQYINFSTPMLVSHFGRELPKVIDYLKIEEFLPGDGEMVTLEGRERAVELVVQFSM